MGETPKISITLTLTSPTLHLSDTTKASKPYLIVTTTLETPSTLTLDTRGERDSGTILGTSSDPDFRVENFTFHDLTVSKVVAHDCFPGTCEWDRDEFIEMKVGVPHVTRMLLDPESVWADPVNVLEPGHEYRISLKPQTVLCWVGGVEELLRRSGERVFEGQEKVDEVEFGVRFAHRVEGLLVRLACEDELVLKVEA